MPPQQSLSVSPRSLDTVSIIALFTTLVAALFVSTSTSSALDSDKTFLLAAGALITLALYILARLARGNIIFPSSLLIGALWLPAVAYALSALFSGTSFTQALWGTALEADTLGFVLIAACLGTLTMLMLRRPEHYYTFLRVGAYVFCIATILQALIIIIGQFAPGTVSPTFSFLGSFEDLASFLGLGLVIILITFRFLALSDRTYRILLACGVVALFLLAVSNVSLVWILLALVSLGLFVEAVMNRRSRTVDIDIEEMLVMDEIPFEADERTHSLIVPLVALAVSLFFVIGGTFGSGLANSLHINTLNVRPSWQSTFAVAYKAYNPSYLFGSGPGTFGVEWLKYRDASLNSTVFWNIDFSSGVGFIPTSFVTTGIVGVIAWLVFLRLLIVLGLRMLILRTPQDSYVRYVSIASFVGAIYLFAVAAFDLPNTVILALAFVFTGVFVSTMRFAVDGEQWGVIFSRSPRMGFVIVFALTILLLSSVAAAYALLEHYFSAAQLTEASNALSAGNLGVANQSAQNSISYAPSAPAYQLQARIADAQLNVIANSSSISSAQAQQAYQTALSSGINAALTSTSLDPSNYRNWMALGNLYAEAVPLGVSGAYDSALTAYQKAQALDPTNPQIPYTLAQLDIANKNNMAAENDLKAAIALKQDYTAAIYLLSQLEVQDGDVKDALAAALAAAYFTPNDPSVLFQVGILRAATGDYANAAIALSAAITANPQFANARYILSVVYAKLGDLTDARIQLQAVSDMSSSNASAVASQLAALTAGKNPFPANFLSAPSAPVR